MKNINYLEAFFRKHNLSGRITVNYLDTEKKDDYMSNIIFEDGEVINIHDIIFDIESDLEEDVFGQWLKARKKNDISLADWIASDNHYTPQDVDKSSIEEYQTELGEIVDTMKMNVDNLFKLDDGDSEIEP